MCTSFRRGLVTIRWIAKSLPAICSSLCWLVASIITLIPGQNVFDRLDIIICLCVPVCEFVCAYGSIAMEFRRAFCRSQWLEGRFQRIRAKRTTLVAANDNEQGPCTRWRFACTGFDPNHDPPGPIRPATETLLHATITLNAP